jgi:cyclophilin family peptidyl-prolyl cis-trans isomerase
MALKKPGQPSPAAPPSGPPPPGGAALPQAIRFETAAGAFEIELFRSDVPLSAAFIGGLVKRGFYDGLHVHRVVDGALVQWGCPFSKDANDTRCGSGSEGFVVDEHTKQHSNVRGSVGLANMGKKDTGSSQLFVNLRDNTDFDWWKAGAVQCVVIGKVTTGLDVLDAIGRTKTAGKLFGDRPVSPVRITRGTVTR